MKARIYSVEQLAKGGGPFVGPRGGMWADPQHTIPWDPEKHGKPQGQGQTHGCPVCRGLGHVVSRQTTIGGPDVVSSAPCRTCNKTNKIPFDPAKAKAMGLPVPPPAHRAAEPPPASKPQPKQLDLLGYRPPAQQASLFDSPKPQPKREEPAVRQPKKGQQLLFRARVASVDDLRKNLPVKERVRIGGLVVAIENPKGSVRKWYDPVKKQHGQTVMVHPYGFIEGTKGADGDDVDAFVGPNRESKLVVIINQRRIDDLRRFDEHKVMLGFDSAAAARKAYLRNYDSKGPQLMGTVRVWTIERFKEWLEHGDTTQPAEKSMGPQLYIPLGAR